MFNINFVNTIAASAVLLLVGCGGNGTNSDNPNESGETNTDSTSQFNPDLEGMVNTGEPGGDITAIAGLWDGTTSNGDVVYWSFAADGVLTRYDFQQDGIPSASGENCYSVSEPITVTPEGGEDYSIGNVAVTAVVNGESLSITFLEADQFDLDENGDTQETPVFVWTRLTTPMLEDLNSCTPSTDDIQTTDEVAGDRPLNPLIPDPPTDTVSLSTFFNGSFDGDAMTGGGFTLLEQAGSALHVRGFWGSPTSYYEVIMDINETTDGTYQLDSGNGGVFQIIGGDAVAASFSSSGESSDTVTFAWDRDAGLIAGDFAFTAVGDDGSRVDVSGEFNTAVGSDGNAWHCNFDDEVISICWFTE